MLSPQNADLRVKTLATIVLGLLATPLHAIPLSNDSTSTNPPGAGEGWDFVWESIDPAPQLVYHRCYDTFECARLQVPLDYSATTSNSSSGGENAYIAIIKIASDPTSFPEYSENWGGPVLINPGGPGGSGVSTVLDTGRELQKVVGKQFSILGFDPRGVNNTRPIIDCFESANDRIAWHMRGGGNKPGNNPEAIGESFARTKAMASKCTKGKKSEYLKYMGTANVAKDMLAITDASWDLAPSAKRKGLQYWGFSYGTLLGATYARLFPDKVERMVLDGVVDALDYYQFKNIKSIQDAEAVMDSFYEFCSQAGPLACSFHTGTHPSHIRLRLQSIVTALQEKPLVYEIPTGGGSLSNPDIFTYNDLRYLIFQSLYDPINLFPRLAAGLVLVEQSLESGYLPQDILGGKVALTCDKDFDTVTSNRLRALEATPGILCGDSTPVVNMTVAEYRENVRNLNSVSPSIGDLWMVNFLPCVGWQIQANWKPNFPPRNQTIIGQTKGAAPILFVGNTADPVTPLANAHNMAKFFPEGGAYVAIQEGEGHCSPSIPSGCMIELINTYFAKGEVPKNETERYCQREIAPFIGNVKQQTKRDPLKDEMINTMKKIGGGITRQLVPGEGFGWF